MPPPIQSEMERSGDQRPWRAGIEALIFGVPSLMSVTRTRRRTAPGVGTLVAFLLVLVFGSPIFVDWANSSTRADTAGGLFLRTLAWPAWSFNSALPVRDVVANDLKAILFILFVGLFVSLLAGA